MVPGSGGKSTPTLRNWTTGLIEATGTPISSARPIFLDTRHILYTAAGGRRDAADQARLCVASLVPSGHTPAQSCSYAFALPEFLLYGVSFVDTRACTLETTPARHGCFYSDPDDRLISIELIFIDWSGRFIIDVPARTLTRYIAAHPAVPGQPAAVVPWDAWGTHGARVTHCPGYTSMSWAISGSRRATLLPRSGVDNTTMLTVLDYSPRRVARAIARGTGNVVRGSEVPAENTGAGFGALRTMLSCISTEIPVPDRLAGGMLRATICENGVLFTKRDARSNTVIDAWAYTI
ncbi:hypothetical protein BV25DRAFT_763306 [Artomyces pyxidatus]|uniref:Uncharacterized protein n=1 Tax=Artomyces pyxidatus TaxID=48021 RepID=A0ACB8T062_9AGAM|nr:hypothetical protein BV25DRAFT_763306 [Artomyces pyxidatus]